MLAATARLVMRTAVVGTIVTLGSVVATLCILQPLTYECLHLPPLIVKYDKVAVSGCDSRLYHKLLFTNQGAVFYHLADPKKTYTLVMVDPDVPLHGDGYFFLHWLHVGLQ
ncbi:hypothetical protein OTU49_007801, partial [Cherax quadricarinatus]